MLLERFIIAQERAYDIALNEIKKGKKQTHWMWYIFPQIAGLGTSTTSKYYGIKSIEEAKEYLNNELLNARLVEISNTLLELDTDNPIEVFGVIDSLKLKSSMTLFSYVSGNEIFNKVLDKFFNGEKDQVTIQICETMNNDKKISSISR